VHDRNLKGTASLIIMYCTTQYPSEQYMTKITSYDSYPRPSHRASGCPQARNPQRTDRQCLARYQGRSYQTSMIRQESHIHDHRIAKLKSQLNASGRWRQGRALSGAIQTKSDSDGGAPGGREGLKASSLADPRPPILRDSISHDGRLPVTVTRKLLHCQVYPLPGGGWRLMASAFCGLGQRQPPCRPPLSPPPAAARKHSQ
jgi:hypothetical protein